MRMAKAPQEQIDRLYRFLQRLGERVEHNSATLPEFVHKHWPAVENCWERILFGYQTLLQITDPNESHLALRSDIAAACTAAGIKDV